MKVNYIRKISAVLLAAVLLVSFVFAATAEVDAASKTKKMKTYKVIARGNTAYCAAYSGIYKVDLITRKSTRLVYGGLDESPVDIRKKGDYIYYNYLTALGNVLGRVNINTKKYKYLHDILKGQLSSYVIDGDKIYYTCGKRHRVMNLNGKAKKKTRIKTKNKLKMANKKGYKLIEKEKGDYIYSYLKTPRQKILVAKVNRWELPDMPE